MIPRCKRNNTSHTHLLGTAFVKIFLILTKVFQIFEKKLELNFFFYHVKVYVVSKNISFLGASMIRWTHQEHFKVIVPLLGGFKRMVKNFF